MNRKLIKLYIGGIILLSFIYISGDIVEYLFFNNNDPYKTIDLITNFFNSILLLFMPLIVYLIYNIKKLHWQNLSLSLSKFNINVPFVAALIVSTIGIFLTFDLFQSPQCTLPLNVGGTYNAPICRGWPFMFVIAPGELLSIPFAIILYAIEYSSKTEYPFFDILYNILATLLNILFYWWIFKKIIKNKLS